MANLIPEQTVDVPAGVADGDEIDLVPFSSVTPEDLVLTGEPDLESLRRRAAHAGAIDDDTLVYRVEFHVATGPYFAGT